jgi:hypothetical protein
MAIFLCTPSTKLRAGYSLLLGLARFGYTVPHRYIELVTDVYDSLEALLLALVMTLGLAVLFSIEIFLYDFIIRLTMKKCTAVDPHGAPLDFDNHLTFGILMASATRFILNLIGEIYDIVLYLINNAPYRLTEIAFLVVSLIMTILFCLITHVACCLIKNRIA